MKVIFLRHNGQRKEISPQNGKEFSLKEMQEYVGGFVEYVGLGDETLIVNEDGKSQKLPVNKAATKMYLDFYKASDFIVGDVILIKSKDLS